MTPWTLNRQGLTLIWFTYNFLAVVFTYTWILVLGLASVVAFPALLFLLSGSGNMVARGRRRYHGRFFLFFPCLSITVADPLTHTVSWRADFAFDFRMVNTDFALHNLCQYFLSTCPDPSMKHANMDHQAPKDSFYKHSWQPDLNISASCASCLAAGLAIGLNGAFMLVGLTGELGSRSIIWRTPKRTSAALTGEGFNHFHCGTVLTESDGSIQ